MNKLSLLILAIAATFVTASCAPKEEQKPAPQPQPKVTTPNQPTPEQLEEMKKQAELRKKNSVCNGPFVKGTPVNLTINGKTYIVDGAYMKAPDNPLKEAKIGVVSDIKNDSPENRVALKEYVSFFKAEGAEMIVVLGDNGERSIDIRETLSILLDSGLPVGVIMGNREPASQFGDAIAQLSAKYPNLINMNIVRSFSSNNFAMFSLPGYYNVQFAIHPEDACIYNENDLKALESEIAAVKDKPVIIISHGPAKGEGKNAIDYASEGGNVGDPALAKLIKTNKVKVGLFSNINEAGGKAVGPDMKTVVKQGDFVASMFMNVGPADTDGWKMNDGSESYGQCGVLHMKDGKYAYKIYKHKKSGSAPAGGGDPLNAPLKLAPEKKQIELKLQPKPEK